MILLRADIISDRDQSNIIVNIGNRHVTLSAEDVTLATWPLDAPEPVARVEAPEEASPRAPRVVRDIETVNEAPERGTSWTPPESAPPSPEPVVTMNETIPGSEGMIEGT